MICRSALSRGAKLALRRQACAGLAQRRGYAAQASTDASYESTEVAGIKIASRDPHGPTTKLAIVAKGGTRYQPLPGLTVGLEEFAFKNTQKRSALRITREAELLGGQLKAYHTREAFVLETGFLRDDLPYFAELLSEVITQTKYTTHEFHEDVDRLLKLKQAKLDGTDLALDAAHAVAFHNGLGYPLYPSGATPLGPYLSEHSVADYASAVYTKGNIAILADGVTQSTLTKWVDAFFEGVPSSSTSSLALDTTASKYHGGEQRVAHQGKNTIVLAFPGYNSASDKPEEAVLTALLGGESNIKWSPGFSLLAKAAASAPGVSSIIAKNYGYWDAGLLAIEISGETAAPVRKAAEEAVKAVKSIAEGTVSKEDLTKAIAKAKFDLLSSNEFTGTGMVAAGNNLIHGGKPFQVAAALKSYESVTADKLKSAAKGLLDGKATVAAVGDLHVLPYAEDLGLKV